jgi:hypothetical protein
MFYSNRETAIEVIRELNNSNQLKAVKRAGLIKESVSSNTDKLTDTAIQAYSGLHGHPRYKERGRHLSWASVPSGWR